MLSQTLATRALAAAGWTIEGGRPDVRKYVCLGVPHSSNWDGLVMLLVAQAIDIRMAWMIKNDWLRGPAGMVLRRMGAVGIDRSRRTNLVQQMVDEFARHDDFVLVIPPEGTRSRAEHWKSGFYNIAVGAGVPVVPGFMDYGRKRVGLGAPIAMTGDVRVDMDAIRHFYDDKDPIGFHPELVGPIALRAETDSSAE